MGELGYVGGSYTKKSAADRYDSGAKEKKKSGEDGYQSLEDLVLLQAGARRVAIP